MPLYEYQCEKCSHRFEAIRRVSDPPPEGCPKCGGAVHKLQSAPAFQFKGSGWYITDYARKGETAAKSEGGEKADGAKTDGAKADGAKADAARTESAAPKKSESKSETAAAS
jgi:putative FmdB family regulatory protein